MILAEAPSPEQRGFPFTGNDGETKKEYGEDYESISHLVFY